MDWEMIAKAVAAILATLAAAAKAVTEVNGRYATRARIDRDLAIYEKLPDGAARQTLLTHIESSVLRLVEDEAEKRRDPTGVVLAGAFLAMSAWAAGEAADGTRLWWILAGVLGILGAVGMSVSLPRAHRDDRGRVVR